MLCCCHVCLQCPSLGCYNSLPKCTISALSGCQDENCCFEIASYQQSSTDNILSAGEHSFSFHVCSVFDYKWFLTYVHFCVHKYFKLGIQLDLVHILLSYC